MTDQPIAAEDRLGEKLISAPPGNRLKPVHKATIIVVSEIQSLSVIAKFIITHQMILCVNYSEVDGCSVCAGVLVCLFVYRFLVIIALFSALGQTHCTRMFTWQRAG